jgi:hypothetical protein
MNNNMNTKALVTTALFVAIALVIRTFSINIVAGGILTMRIRFAAIFYVLPRSSIWTSLRRNCRVDL